MVSAVTLRQVIKSTVANMNTRQQQQTSQITIHMKKITQTEIHKFQVSGFTNKLFHISRNNKTPKLQLSANSKNSCKLLGAQTQQSLSSLASSQTILSDLTGFKKHIHWSYPTRYRSQSYLTGHRSELYMNCMALSLDAIQDSPLPVKFFLFQGSMPAILPWIHLFQDTTLDLLEIGQVRSLPTPTPRSLSGGTSLPIHLGSNP